MISAPTGPQQMSYGKHKDAWRVICSKRFKMLKAPSIIKQPTKAIDTIEEKIIQLTFLSNCILLLLLL